MSHPLSLRPLRRALPVLALALCACAPGGGAQVSMNRVQDASALTDSAGLRGFPGHPGRPPVQGNAEIAQDILDLQFAMESGRPLPVLSRFDGPITIALTGDVPPTAPADLARVMLRFRTEAGLDLRPAPKGERANITMIFQPRATLARLVPNAACFVVPNVSSLQEYRAKRSDPQTDWARVAERSHLAIFAPSDTSPQEVRDCLHEEVAQAMGPINDLYRLSDSVFNDDNFHTVLTGFDMLVLRVHNDPALRVGMTKAEVAARLPAILTRLNPAGEGPHPMGDLSATPKAWEAAGEQALGKGRVEERLLAANRMLSIAKAQGWQDGRLAFSLFAHGRAIARTDMAAAMADFTRAAQIYRSLPGGEVQAAHIDAQMAAFSLNRGDATAALALTDRALPVAVAAENAALLATLYLIRAEALEAKGQGAAARRARLDSLGWARYGFGSDAQVRARLDEIATIAKGPGRG